MHPTAPEPLAILDVHYADPGATAACVVARGWSDEHGCEERLTRLAQVQPYRPGAFYERELPCLLAVLEAVTTPFRALVIDGYVELDERGSPGLGAHLHAYFGGEYPVIGVAKTAYRGSSFAARVVRGSGERPLFVTTRGVSRELASELVGRMHGPYRVPTLLRRVDQLARGLAPLPEP